MTPITRWALWLMVALCTFLGMEIYALRTHEQGGTLSEVIRWGVGIHPKAKRRWVLIPAFVCLVGWFGVHILDSEDE